MNYTNYQFFYTETTKLIFQAKFLPIFDMCIARDSIIFWFKHKLSLSLSTYFATDSQVQDIKLSLFCLSLNPKTCKLGKKESVNQLQNGWGEMG